MSRLGKQVETLRAQLRRKAVERGVLLSELVIEMVRGPTGRWLVAVAGSLRWRLRSGDGCSDRGPTQSDRHRARSAKEINMTRILTQPGDRQGIVAKEIEPSRPRVEERRIRGRAH